MKNLYTLLFISLILGLLNACTFREEIFIRKNFSGEIRYISDLSSMVGMVNSLSQMDSSGNTKSAQEVMPNEQFAKKADALTKLTGISKIRQEADTSGKYTLIFEFADIDALNRAYTILNQNDDGDMPASVPPDFKFFTRSGKTFSYQRPVLDLNNMPMSDSLRQNQEMMKGMIESMRLESAITFERKVKSAKSEGFEQTQEGKTIKLGGQYINLGKAQQKLTVQLK